MTSRRYWTTILPEGGKVVLSCIYVGDDDTSSTSKSGHEIVVSAENASLTNLSIDPASTQVLNKSIEHQGTESNNTQFRVFMPPGVGIVRSRVIYDEGTHSLFLPGPDFLNAVIAATEGDRGAAKTVLTHFSTPIQAPAICGAFLTIDEIGALLQAISELNEYSSGRLHAYRYNLIRGAIISSSGLSVNTADELESLIDCIADIDGMESVTVPEALGGTIARISPNKTGLTQLLSRLGYELSELEQRDDGLFFICHIAQLVETEGFRAAEGHVMQRRWRLSGDYRRRKSEAEAAEYEDRGRAWRELLCAAARQSINEFAEVLAHALYWSGEVLRTKSRTDELLFSAAHTVAEKIGHSWIEGRAQYEQRMARGHRLRSQNCFSMAKYEFEKAASVAAECRGLPEWKPIYDKATVLSSEYRINGNPTQSVTVLEETLVMLSKHDIRAEKREHITHHLKAQIAEATAQVPSVRNDPADVISFLQDAQTHYKSIDFSRLQKRVEKKIHELKSNRTSESSSNTGSEAPTTTKPSTATQQESESSSSHVSNSTRRPETVAQRLTTNRNFPQTSERIRSEHARDSFEPNPDLDDFLTPSDPSEVGS